MAKLGIKDLEKMSTFQIDILSEMRWEIEKECIDTFATKEEETQIFKKYMKKASELMQKWGYSKKAIKEYFENVWF